MNGFMLESGSPLDGWLARMGFGSMSGTRQKQLARQPVFFLPLPKKQRSKDPKKQIFASLDLCFFGICFFGSLLLWADAAQNASSSRFWKLLLKHQDLVL